MKPLQPDGPFGPVPTPPAGWDSWNELMERALEQARLGAVRGEVPVGAIVVDAKGRILGAAHNRPSCDSDPSAHAEMLALREAAATLGNYRLDGAYLVVTLEPCMMCAGAAVHARVAGVIYGADDPKAGAVSSCLDGLELPFHNHHPWHMGGILRGACAEVLQTFFKDRRVASDNAE